MSGILVTPYTDKFIESALEGSAQYITLLIINYKRELGKNFQVCQSN